MYQRKEDRMKVLIGAYKGLILTLPLSVYTASKSQLLNISVSSALVSEQVAVLVGKITAEVVFVPETEYICIGTRCIICD